MKYFISILIIFVTSLGVFNEDLFADTLPKEQKKATVLLIHMFGESYEKSTHLSFGTILERIEKAFQEKGTDVSFIPVSANQRIQDPERRRQQMFAQIDGLLLKSRNTMHITHIVFAGHGQSKGANVLIGDLVFSDNTIGQLVVDFGLIRQFLAPKVKVFLYGCSTFKGTEKEILAKAEWFRRILKAKEVEVFGYEHPIYDSTSDSFWAFDVKNWLALYSGMLFVGFFKYGSDNDMLFTKRLWLTFAKSMVAVPGAALTSYVFEHWLKYTNFITMLRERYYYDNIGTVVSFDRYTPKRIARLLGHDYFRLEYVQ